jgi:hypothetical protein
LEASPRFFLENVYSAIGGERAVKGPKNWSRKKIVDEFTGMLKADGTPMSRQQIHMLRKKAKGICLTCGKPSVGVYCAEHTIQARERMRKVLHSKRRHLNSPSYHLEESAKLKGRLVRIHPEMESHSEAA